MKDFKNFQKGVVSLDDYRGKKEGKKFDFTVSVNAILHTDGTTSLWSRKKANVKITKIVVSDLDEAYKEDGFPLYGTAKFYFDRSTWKVSEDGLIYTDEQFNREAQLLISKHIPRNWTSWKLSYSEQGLQGKNYVDFDFILEKIKE